MYHVFHHCLQHVIPLNGSHTFGSLKMFLQTINQVSNNGTFTSQFTDLILQLKIFLLKFLSSHFCKKKYINVINFADCKVISYQNCKSIVMLLFEWV